MLGRRSAFASGVGSGLASLAAGLTLWGVLVLGVAAVGSGALSRVPLAVLTLTALAAFEAVTALPAAAVQLSQARTSAVRIAEVTDAPEPVREPATPRPLPVAILAVPDGGTAAGAAAAGRYGATAAAASARRVTVRLRDARARYQPGGPLAIDGISLDLRPGRRVALVGPNGVGQVDRRRGAASVPRPGRRFGHARRARAVRLPRPGRARGDRRLPAGPAHLRRHHRREPAAGQAGSQRRPT